MNPKRFIQVETAFFWRWWNEQNEFMKNLVKDLVAEASRCRRYVFKNYMNMYIVLILLILLLNMKMNEFLEIMSPLMIVTKTPDNSWSPNCVDPCSFFEFSINFSILQNLQNWDTWIWIIITAGIQSFSFLQIASCAIFRIRIFFCHSVDFQ